MSANRDRHRDHIRTVRARLARHGPPKTRDQPGDFERITVPQQDCDELRDLLITERVETIIEIGLAYGSSALAIGEALVSVGARSPRHVVIDPFQESEWSNAGWQMLKDARLDSIATVIAEPSSIALPRLVSQGLVTDAAFVDGGHRFHDVFVDLYFLRKIVRPGGLVILDDYWWLSVRTAAHYYETNAGWRAVPGAFSSGSVDPATGLGRLRALRLPDPAWEPDFDAFQPF